MGRVSGAQTELSSLGTPNSSPDPGHCFRGPQRGRKNQLQLSIWCMMPNPHKVGLGWAETQLCKLSAGSLGTEGSDNGTQSWMQPQMGGEGVGGWGRKERERDTWTSAQELNLSRSQVLIQIALLMLHRSFSHLPPNAKRLCMDLRTGPLLSMLRIVTVTYCSLRAGTPKTTRHCFQAAAYRNRGKGRVGTKLSGVGPGGRKGAGFS